jgi:predicted glycoside hydrolase/deacetylase ChbG (UPF0249 family)
MYRLIVHADDFGLSERINEGILQAPRHGILTSTSLLATGPAFEQAVKICRTVPRRDCRRPERTTWRTEGLWIYSAGGS